MEWLLLYNSDEQRPLNRQIELLNRKLHFYSLEQLYIYLSATSTGKISCRKQRHRCHLALVSRYGRDTRELLHMYAA